jgi:NADH-quinone oxidoreductase subunit L
VWYNVFFGDEAKMRAWFGMPEGAHHAAEGETAEGHAAPAEGAAVATEGHAAPAAGEAVAAEGHGDAAPAADAVTEAAPMTITGSAPQGAIFLGPENNRIHEAHEVPKWVKVSPFVAMVLGLLLAIQFYIVNPALPGRLAKQQAPLYNFLLNKWYFDEAYNFLFVRPAFWIGRFLWKRGDGDVIDGSINGVALGIIPFFTRLAGRAQSGYLFHYAFAMFLGIGALITWMTLGSAQ